MTLDENDFLTFQLYTASKTPRIKKARIRNWIIVTLASLCLAYLFYESGNVILGNYFLIVAGLSATLYPFYTRWWYRKHYLKYIRDTYKNRIGEQCELDIDENTIGAKDSTGIVKINKSEIKEINEIKDYYFLKARTGTTLIISKVKTDEIEKIENEVKFLVEKFGAKHNIELNWKWK
jgi:hypothetical protein